MNAISLLILSCIIAYYVLNSVEGFHLTTEVKQQLDQKQPIINNLEVSSNRQDTVIRGDPKDGLGRQDKLILEDQFEEVKQIFGHGYAPHDYKMASVDTDAPIYLPSKRLIDAHGGNYFLPELPCPDVRFYNDPTPLDKENIFSRNRSHNFHVEKNVHPLRRDVQFLVTDN